MELNKILGRGDESGHQKVFFAWCNVALNAGFEAAHRWAETDLLPTKGRTVGIPELKWIHHIPNGGSRGDTVRTRAINGARLAAEGVKKGIPDIFWPFKSGGFSGLYIEMKHPNKRPNPNRTLKKNKAGGLTDEQLEFIEYAKSQGFVCAVRYDWKEAVSLVEDYYNYGKGRQNEY